MYGELDTWRTLSTVERAHGVKTGHHWGGRTSPIVRFTFIHVLAAVAIALPAWMGDTRITAKSIHRTDIDITQNDVVKFRIYEQMA